MSDKFLGRWLVSEYVFNPNGQYVGKIEQKRELHQRNDGRIRVVQNCKPEAALANHPMGKFAGEWEFDLSVDGRLRRYHGPAVIGTGLPWRDGVMTGSGIWPDFGYSFRSYGILINPQRQLTGGQFFLPGEMVANIIGVAVPEEVSSEYPQLDLEQFQSDQQMTGTRDRYNVNGVEIEAESITRISVKNDDGFNWEENESKLIFKKRPEKSIWQCQQDDLHGFGRRFGPAVMIDLHSDKAIRQTIFSMFDSQTCMTVELWHLYKNEQLHAVEYVCLS